MFIRNDVLLNMLSLNMRIEYSFQNDMYEFYNNKYFSLCFYLSIIIFVKFRYQFAGKFLLMLSSTTFEVLI